MSDKIFSYTVNFELNELGGYTVTVAALPGLVTEGRTLQEAKEMAVGAIKCYLEGLIKDGESIPEERSLIHEKLDVVLSNA